MSITTLKRKTDGSYHVNGGKHGEGYVNKISSGRPAFSLNDSRRVEAHLGRSADTRMRGTGFKGHGGHLGKFPIVPILSNNQNLYDPFGKPRRGKPVIVPECPVVQQTTPLSYKIYYNEKDNLIIKKDLCDPTSKESGNCGSKINTHDANCKQTGTYVKRKQLDYSQYLYKLKKPLTGDQKHYPPMVSRNSIFVSVPNFSYAEFIKRVQCK